MIGKNEKVGNDNTNATSVNVNVNEKRKLLQDTSAKVQEEVKLCFEQLAKVLQAREKQLLRQVQAVHNQQLTIVQSNAELPPSVPVIKVNLSRQQDLQDSILKFGELVLSDRNSIIASDAEPYKIEEYVEADKDHISFDKSIIIDREQENIVGAQRLDGLCELIFDTGSAEYAEADKEHISFDKSIVIDREQENIVGAERLDGLCELILNNSSVEYAEADKEHISFDKSILIDREEKNIVGAERLCELIFNTSSEADITLENEITVLMNHNYSSSSDGLTENPNSPELLAPKSKDANDCTKESKCESTEDSIKISDNSLEHSNEREFEISDRSNRVNGDCIVPEKKEDLIVEKSNSLTKENNRNLSTNENKGGCRLSNSGSPTEKFEKNGDCLVNKKTQDCDQHPKQIQQWLQQILVETETEPTIHEVEQFAEIFRFKEF